MKKAMLVIIFVTGFVLLSACATKTPAQPAPQPAPQPTQQTTRTQPAETEPSQPRETTRTAVTRGRNDIIIDGSERYFVISGDTLSGIAWNKYGDGYFYPLILLASDDVVSDPDLIYPGNELTIPILGTNIDDERARAGLKRALNDIADIESRRNRGETARGMRDKANDL
jgi:hypothetical protein